MKLKVFVLVLIIMLTAVKVFHSFSQEEQYSIDKWLDSCISKDSSTASTTNCAEQAYKKWDTELNKYYQLLKNKLNNQGKTQLKNSELAWIKFRDLEFKVIDNLYNSQLQGTMYIPLRIQTKTRVIKYRTLQLKIYCELLSGY